MKLAEITYPNWDKFKIRQSIIIGNIKIVILQLLPSEVQPLPSEGVKNLMATDLNTDQIIWIANIPIIHGKYGAYDYVCFESGKLTAWCGSILCLIDLATGELLDAEFVK
jgi:hypothetical protein